MFDGLVNHAKKRRLRMPNDQKFYYYSYLLFTDGQ